MYVGEKRDFKEQPYNIRIFINVVVAKTLRTNTTSCDRLWALDFVPTDILIIIVSSVFRTEIGVILFDHLYDNAYKLERITLVFERDTWSICGQVNH